MGRVIVSFEPLYLLGLYIATPQTQWVDGTGTGTVPPDRVVVAVVGGPQFHLPPEHLLPFPMLLT